MNIGNGRETTTATVLYSLRSRKVVKMKTTEDSRGTAMNTGRTGRNPTADLFYGVAKTYRCWKGAEVAAVCLVKLG